MQAVNFSKRTFSGEHNCIFTKINETLIIRLTWTGSVEIVFMKILSMEDAHCKRRRRKTRKEHNA
jgi:hypothetical protein